MTDNRPSKKQRELLQFIDGFIKGYGYGPSYREIMRALGYKSVSTVAVHVDGLIARGYVRKITHSARSLEVISAAAMATSDDDHTQWLARTIAEKLDQDLPAEDKAALERTLTLFAVAPEDKKAKPAAARAKPAAQTGESTSGL